MTLLEAYKVIGVKESDTIEVIKKRYRKLARENHPDVSEKIDAEEITKRLNVAYDIIIKSKKEEQSQTSKEDTSSKAEQKEDTSSKAKQKEDTSSKEHHYDYKYNQYEYNKNTYEYKYNPYDNVQYKYNPYDNNQYKYDQNTYDYNKESERLYKMYTDEKYVGATAKDKEFIDWLNDYKRIEKIAAGLNTTRAKLYAKYVSFIYNHLLNKDNLKLTFIEYVELTLMCHNMNKTIEELEKEHKEALTGHITNKENFLEYVLERKQIKEISKYIGIREEDLKLDYLYQRVIGKLNNCPFIEFAKEKYLEYISSETKYKYKTK